MERGAATFTATGGLDSEAAGRNDLATTRAAAFRGLVAAHLDAIYARAVVLLGNTFEAEDAVHDAAERAWQRWDSLQDQDRFEAWFARILLNVCRDRLRRRRRVAAIETSIIDGFSGRPAGDMSAAIAERDRVRRLLDGLTPDERIVVVLRFESDLTIPAIGALLAVPEGTVKSRLHRALERLRAAEEGSEHG